jgi:hypothetical protein
MTAGEVALIVVIAVIVVAAVIVGLLGARRRRSRRLQERFGPEYERTVAESEGNRRAAEAELLERQAHREKLNIVPLQPAARERYLQAWHLVQAKFVDEPILATRDADRLITEVMRERGYPVDDFEQRAADISVDHPQVVEDYRQAHNISLANDRGEADTEALRQALVHYRSLFEELLETAEPQDGQPAASRDTEPAASRDTEPGARRIQPVESQRAEADPSTEEAR